jgi:hypothetical protein
MEEKIKASLPFKDKVIKGFIEDIVLEVKPRR